MKTIELPPNAPALMESTRAMGYSTPAAVADIIDNSVAAYASNVDLLYYPNSDPYLAILDDGSGMAEEKLQAAMQYGSRSPTSQREAYDLGRYGLGMKTASLSQCRSVTVISRRDGITAGCRWNLDEIERHGTWSLDVLEDDDIARAPHIERLNTLQHGTLVLWEDLDRMLVGEANPRSTFTKKMEIVREHLGLVFHRYISGENGLQKLTIRMNGVPVDPVDPFLLPHSTPIMDEERLVLGDAVIRVRPYTLPHMSKMTKAQIALVGGKDGLRKTQGFYVYRNKRLVIWGTWFKLHKMDELTKLARVQIDIPNTLDDLWTLDIKKSSAMPPEAVRVHLRHIIDKIASSSAKVFTTRAKRQSNSRKAYDKVWERMELRDHAVRYEINKEHPLVKRMVEMYPEMRSDLMAFLRNVEDGLPLHELKVELDSDKTFIVNMDGAEAKEIEQQIRTLIASVSSTAERQVLLKQLRHAEPFCYHPQIMDQFLQEEV